MTAPIAGLADVLSRIAAIQAQMSSPPGSVAGPVATTTSPQPSPVSPVAASPAGAARATQAASTGSSFQNTLDEAQGTSVTRDGVTYGPSSAGVTGADVVAHAESYLGVPYVYAGTTRAGGMDCSGLVQTTYKELGMKLPRISYQQQKVGVAVPSLAQAQPGDVLAFGQPAYHVAIYVGDGKMIEAPQPGENVKIANVHPTPSSIRRIVPTGLSADASTTTATAASSTLAPAAPVSSSSSPQTHSRSRFRAAAKR